MYFESVIGFFSHRHRLIPNTTRGISHRGTTWMTSVVNEYVKKFPEEPSARAVQVKFEKAGMGRTGR